MRGPPPLSVLSKGPTTRDGSPSIPPEVLDPRSPNSGESVVHTEESSFLGKLSRDILDSLESDILDSLDGTPPLNLFVGKVP